MLKNVNPLRFGCVLGCVLIAIFSIRFFMFSIHYYLLFNKLDVASNEVESMQFNRQYYYYNVNKVNTKAFESMDYNYPYDDAFNYPENYGTDFPVDELRKNGTFHTYIRFSTYLTTTYWGAGLLSIPLLLLGIFLYNDVCVFVWLYLMAFKITSTIKLIVNILFHMEQMNNKMDYSWSYADFAFVLFLVYFWFVVYFYFLQAQSTFYLSAYVTGSESSTSDYSSPVTPVESTVKVLEA